MTNPNYPKTKARSHKSIYFCRADAKNGNVIRCPDGKPRQGYFYYYDEVTGVITYVPAQPAYVPKPVEGGPQYKVPDKIVVTVDENGDMITDRDGKVKPIQIVY